MSLSFLTELVTVTKGRKHFKIYEIKTGKTKAVVRCPSEGDCRLKSLKVGSTSKRGPNKSNVRKAVSNILEELL